MEEKIYVDMNCANCGHSPEAHWAGEGQCYKCDSRRRCPAWKPKSQEASMVAQGKNPWQTFMTIDDAYPTLKEIEKH
jgi:hypothetical protein